ncbi:MAG: glycosyltransferase family 2 protein [Candidatus Bathyarchaeia archaeon]
MNKSVDVSVILCAYNEGKVIGDAIARVVQVMNGAGYNFEVIVVDDGSQDDTKYKVVKYIEANGDKPVKVMRHEKNLGKGSAIKTGFANSRGRYIVILDGDLDVDPELIPSYVKALEKNDVAVASKWHPMSRIAVPLKRKTLSFGFNILAKIFTGIKLRDTQTGLKALRREVLERLSPKLVVNRYAFDLELVGACNHSGYKIVELPVNVRINNMVGFRDILRMALDLLKVAYRLRVLKCYQRVDSVS